MDGPEIAEERSKRVVGLLEDNVRTELRVVNAALDLGLGDDAIDSLMQGVTSGLLSAFTFDWSPDWVAPGAVHRWTESGTFFARCGVCLADSPSLADEQTAIAWARKHEESHA